MDAFTNLEKKVEKLIAAYQELQSRVADLEDENGKLKDAASEGGSKRIGELEAERAELRERLAALVGKIDEIDL